MNRLIVVSLLVIWSDLMLFGQPAQVIVSDTSRSQLRWAAKSRAEQKQLIAALPNESQVVILGVGNSVQRFYEGPLDASHRATANASIDAMPTNDQNTALGEGISEALRVIAGIAGTPKGIWVFTDGQNSPPQNSRYRGTHLNRILDELTLSPGTQLYIRVFGSEQVLSNQPAVHVLKSTPVWSDVFSPLSVPPRAATQSVSQPKSKEALPFVGAVTILATAIVLGVIGLMIARRKRSSDILANVAPESVPEPEPPQNTLPTKVFSIFIEGRNDPVVLAPDQCTEIVIGGSPAADVYLTACNEQIARFWFDGTPNSGAIVIRNDGIGEIAIGRRKLRSGQSVRLPDSPVEMKIGSQIIHVMGDTLIGEEARR